MVLESFSNLLTPLILSEKTKILRSVSSKNNLCGPLSLIKHISNFMSVRPKKTGLLAFDPFDYDYYQGRLQCTPVVCFWKRLATLIRSQILDIFFKNSYTQNRWLISRYFPWQIHRRSVGQDLDVQESKFLFCGLNFYNPSIYFENIFNLEFAGSKYL